MRSKQSKTKRVNEQNMPSNTRNETPNIGNEPQPTLHNGAYKMTIIRV